jgi:hypothetical protein
VTGQARQQQKAERWDALMGVLSQPGLKDTAIRHLSVMRRAALMLLANRHELPASLAAELTSYQATLDELYFEAADGFADVEGILNFLPAYITGFAAAGLYRPGPDDDDEEGVEWVR